MSEDNNVSSFSVKKLEATLTVEPGAFSVADLEGGCFLNTLVRGAVSCDDDSDFDPANEEEEEVAEFKRKRVNNTANDDDDSDFDPANEEEEEEEVAECEPRKPRRRKARACSKRVQEILKWEECSEDSPEYQAADRRMRAVLRREKRRRRY